MMTASRRPPGRTGELAGRRRARRPAWRVSPGKACCSPPESMPLASFRSLAPRFLGVVLACFLGLCGAQPGFECIKGDCQNGQGVSYSNSQRAKYGGGWKRGKRHGYGILYAGQDSYEGEWANGEMSGLGILKQKTPKGHEEQTGMFLHSVLQSEEDIPIRLRRAVTKAYRDAEGFQTGGLCAQGDCLNGYGVYMSEGGVTSQGEQTGSSSQTGMQGSEYAGQWKSGRMHGYGVLVYPHGIEYHGQWENGAQEGQGTVMSRNGGRHESGWWNGNVLVSQQDVPRHVVMQASNAAKKAREAQECAM